MTDRPLAQETVDPSRAKDSTAPVDWMQEACDKGAKLAVLRGDVCEIAEDAVRVCRSSSGTSGVPLIVFVLSRAAKRRSDVSLSPCSDAKRG